MPLATPDIETLEQFVLGKCDSFTNMQVWPAGEKFRPQKWLKNFSNEEKEHALYLLNSFVFYNLEMCIALLKSCVSQLSNSIAAQNSLSGYSTMWDQYLADTLFIPSTGESRNVTDSGNLLAAYLRRDLLIPQYNILTVDQLYDSAYKSQISGYKNVVFFDDFIGSGRQFITLWTEDFDKDAKLYNPVGTQCVVLGLKPYYCSLIGTTYGVRNIQDKCSEVELHCAHILPETVSPLHPKSIVWPAHLQESGPEFVLAASRKAGIAEKDIKGFHNLGLALAFHFTIPDATLPIFRWQQNNWAPLMVKT